MKTIKVAGCLLLVGTATPTWGQPALAWELQELRGPRWLWAGSSVTYEVVLKNRGSEPWSHFQGDRLSYHWLGRDGSVILWDGLRTFLPRSVAPGQEVRLTMAVRAPQATGKLLLQLDLVRENVRWYGAPVGGSALYPCTILPRMPFLLGGFAGLSLVGLLLLRRWGLPAAAAGPVAVAWAVGGLWALTFAFHGAVDRPDPPAVVAWGMAALWAFPVALSPRGWQWLVAGGELLLLTGLTFADLLYFRFFRSILPTWALAAVGQGWQVRESIAALTQPGDGWFAAAALGAVLGALCPRSRGEKRGRLPFWGSRVATVGVLVVLAWPGVRALRQAMGEKTTWRQVFSYEGLLPRLGVFGLHTFDVARTLEGWLGRRASPQEKAQVAQFFARRAAEAQGPWPAFGVARGANLILIQVESLQQFVVELAVAGQPVMPFLQQLKGQALYFPWIFDQTHQGRSADGEFIVLNSQHALAEGAAAFRVAGNRFVALPHLLRQHGYTTLSAHPFDRGFWNRAQLHPREGFQQSFFRRELGPGETIGWGLADGVFFERMVPLLKKTPQPFFAFLITLGLHHPFDLFPDRHKYLKLPPLRDPALANYLHAMHYFDRSLERFFAQLEQAGLLQNTVVALYGDHESGIPVGQELLELLGISAFTPPWPRLMCRVPLFLALPRGQLFGTVPVVGGQVDIGPTLLHLLGIPRPKAFVGRVLAPEAPLVVALPDGSGVSQELVWWGPKGKCWRREGGELLPAAACQQLAAHVAEELAASRTAVLKDLVADLGNPQTP